MSTPAIPRPAVLPSEVLSDESKWITEGEAQNAAGEWVSPTDSKAAGFCMVGAVYRAFGGSINNPVVTFTKRLKAHTRAQWLGDWNDEPGRTFDEVRAALLAVEAELGWHAATPAEGAL